MLKYWSPIIVTPIFQMAAYAQALLLAAQTDTSDEAIGALVDCEAGIARLILDRADPPDVVALIDELALHRMIGSPEVMHEQLATYRGSGGTLVRVRSGRARGGRRDGGSGRGHEPSQR